jgi:phosphonate transport system substrate-binding protein
MERASRAVALVVAVLATVALTFGCGGGGSGSSGAKAQGAREGSNRPEVVRFTFTDLAGLSELQRNFGPFREELSEVLGTEVELFPVSDRLAAVEAMNAGQVDLVLTGSSEYVAIRAETEAVPLVGIERPGNFTQIRTHEGSGIESIEDLRGERIDAIAAGSTSGHLGTAKLLADNGIDPQSDVEMVFLGPTAGIEALTRGELPAQGRNPISYEVAAERAGVDLDRLPVVAEGPVLPPDAFVASPELPEEYREEVGRALVENEGRLLEAILQAEDIAAAYEGEGTRFVRVDDSDYDYMREAWRAVGVEDFAEIPDE